MANRNPKTDLQAIFDDRSASIYFGMVARTSEKLDPSGKVRRLGRPMPFTLPEFRGWLLGRLAGGVVGVVQCGYCNARLNIQTLHVDHAVPLAAPWYGSAALNNLVCACRICNTRKGKMSAQGFRKLVAWGCRELDERDFRDMLGRMANGGGYLKMKLALEARASTKNVTGPAAMLFSIDSMEHEETLENCIA